MKNYNTIFLYILLSLIFSCKILLAQKEIFVDLNEQRAYAIKNGKRLFSGKISSGKKGRETPIGHYKVLEKDRYHVSNSWPAPNGGAKMPYMIRLTNSGIAMHQGRVPGYPASHGCIRLNKNFAKKLFRWTDYSTVVIISAGTGSNFYDFGGEYINVNKSHKLIGSKKDKDGYSIIENY